MSPEGVRKIANGDSGSIVLNETLPANGLKLVALPFCFGWIDRTNLRSVVNTFVAKVGAADDWLLVAQDRRKSAAQRVKGRF